MYLPLQLREFTSEFWNGSSAQKTRIMSFPYGGKCLMVESVWLPVHSFRYNYYYYYRVLRAICCQPVDGSHVSAVDHRQIWSMDKKELTMCDIVWISPQLHSSLSLKPHFLWHALQWPWPVRKRFSSDHWRLCKTGKSDCGSTIQYQSVTDRETDRQICHNSIELCMH